MNRSAIFLIVLVLLVISIACNLPAGMVSDPVETTAPVATESQPDTVSEPQVTATETSPPPPSPSPTTAPPTPTIIPPVIQPVGFGSGDLENETITFYNTGGQALGTIAVPGLSSPEPEHVHIAGPYTGNLQALPLVYHSWGNNGEIKQSLGGNVEFLVTQLDVSELCGAPAQNVYVYSEILWGGEALQTYFYLRTPAGGGASWFWDRDDPTSWAMFPLAVEASNGQVQGLWYTLKPWGIGGDIVFPPQKGLFYLKPDTLEHSLVLTEGFNPVGISPDNNLVAYLPAEHGFIEGADSTLTIYNLESGVMTTVALAPSSDRGAGYAVFSPDNRYLAWMEGSGWQMAETPNFTSRVRIAGTDGSLLADIPASTFASAAGDPSVKHVVPVGWIDTEHLLVEARGAEWYWPALIRIRFDGSNPTRIANGSFIGFLYEE
ncbi:MAG: hypothetical protein JW862_16025 [Anaerolineales bacterium]|nr:hypothetical protein [Anaerolineales bacterium]